MRLSFRAVRASLFALGVAASLGFGAATTLAAPTRLPACKDPGANGPCGSDSGCSATCDQLGFGPWGACNERTYCCYCLAE